MAYIDEKTYVWNVYNTDNNVVVTQCDRKMYHSDDEAMCQVPRTDCTCREVTGLTGRGLILWPMTTKVLDHLFSRQHILEFI